MSKKLMSCCVCQCHVSGVSVSSRTTYATEFPLLLLSDPTCLARRQLDEVLIGLDDGRLRLLEHDLSVFGVRDSSSKADDA
jgi:hypothetical protein